MVGLTSDLQRLAVLAALRKGVCDAYDEVKGRVDADMQAAKTLKQVVDINGEPVAVWAAIMRKEPSVDAYAEWELWALENGLAVVVDTVNLEAMDDVQRSKVASFAESICPGSTGREIRFDPNWKKRFKRGPAGGVLDPETGEVVPGLRWCESFKGSRLADPDAQNRQAEPWRVAAAVGGAYAGLIMGEAFALEGEVVDDGQ